LRLGVVNTTHVVKEECGEKHGVGESFDFGVLLLEDAVLLQVDVLVELARDLGLGADLLQIDSFIEFLTHHRFLEQPGVRTEVIWLLKRVGVGHFHEGVLVYHIVELRVFAF